MSLYGFTCIRCERRVVPDLIPDPMAAVCPNAPDRGPHEALPSAFMPRGWPPHEDFTWAPEASA